jgi:hypothetical protein
VLASEIKQFQLDSCSAVPEPPCRAKSRELPQVRIAPWRTGGSSTGFVRKVAGVQFHSQASSPVFDIPMEGPAFSYKTGLRIDPNSFGRPRFLLLDRRQKWTTLLFYLYRFHIGLPHAGNRIRTRLRRSSVAVAGAMELSNGGQEHGYFAKAGSSFARMVWYRIRFPLRSKTASFSDVLLRNSMCPNEGEAPVTRSRTTRIDLIPIPRDSIHSRISRSEEFQGRFIRRRFDMAVAPRK